MGASRATGRMLAWLLIADEPQSLDDLVHVLHISKAAASQGTRVLERTGFIERVTVPGDRKAYYQASPDMSSAIVQTSVIKMDEMARLADDGIRAVGEENQTARQRLARMSRLYRHIRKRMPEILREIETEEE
nr:MarR family transcriptional regulator [Limnochorda pilosa]